MKLCTIFEVSSFVGFGDIIEGMPNILGVTCPKPRPLSETGYQILVARDQAKMFTKFEVDPTVRYQVMTFICRYFPLHCDIDV